MNSDDFNTIEIKCYELKIIKELKKEYENIKDKLVHEIYDEFINEIYKIYLKNKSELDIL